MFRHCVHKTRRPADGQTCAPAITLLVQRFYELHSTGCIGNRSASTQSQFEIWPDRMKALQSQIKDWSCYDMKTKDFNQHVTDLELKSRLPSDPEIKINVFTLNSLKSQLQKNGYYLNFILYSNIAFDTIIYLSIKEGLRVFQRTKQFFSSRCSTNDVHRKIYFSKYDVYIIRTKVFLFQCYYDALVVKILEKHHIDVTKTKESGFLKRVNETLIDILYILELPMHVQWNARREYICSKIEQILQHVKTPFPNQKLTELELDMYLLRDPILNIYKLLYL